MTSLLKKRHGAQQNQNKINQKELSPKTDRDLTYPEDILKRPRRRAQLGANFNLNSDKLN
jgi:hypothetical protein